ncbi:DUF2663 family protein [Pseudalkalibacillus hwajinpoensis]|uniref:DUF2663 family protein n=1 Tax=Guptibacillus hwajinpoensis TaxID=208199 RepID=UPI00325A7D6F
MTAFKQWNLPQPQSDVTMVLLQELVDRKNEEEKYKAKSLLYGYVFMLFVLITGGLVVLELERSTTMFISILTLKSNPFLTLFFLLSIVVYYQVRKFTKKCKKAEDELESLRIEVLDRSDELFEEKSQWQNRHDVFKHMKERYDINLYYK